MEKKGSLKSLFNFLMGPNCPLITYDALGGKGFKLSYTSFNFFFHTNKLKWEDGIEKPSTLFYIINEQSPRG